MPAQLPRRSSARCASTPAAPAEPATAAAVAATTTPRAAQEIAAQAAATTTAAARVNQVSVEFQLFFFTAPFFPLYFALPISLSSLAFACYIRFIACKALLVPLCKLCALKLCSCLRQQKARTKRDGEKRQNNRCGERESEKRGHIFKCTLRFPSSSLYLVLRLCVSTALPSLSSAFLLCLAVPIAVYWAQRFFLVRFQNYLLDLHSHSCSTVRMALFVYISIAIWPTVPGNKQTPCGNIAFEELLHVSDDRCPHPSLGQVFVCILYGTRKGKSCRDTSVLDSRNINSHLFAFTI